MTFLFPYWFLLLFLLPFIIWLDFFNRKKGSYFRNSSLLQKIYGQNKWKYFYLPIILKTIIFILFVCILANPVSSSVRTEVSKNGIDIVIVFDISKSMLAEDIKPNRIEAAKKVMSDFISHFTSDRLAIVLFAGKPFLSTPLTFDYTALVDAVEQMTTDSIRQDIPGLSGTAMGDGILVGLDTLKGDKTHNSNNERKKVIIVLTDGEANVGINPTIATKLAKEQEVKIYTLGIGDPKGTELYVTDRYGEKQYFLDQMGKPIHATLDEKMLTNIALITGGLYFNAKDQDSLASVFKDLEKLTKTDIKTTSIILRNPEYHWFLYGIFLLFPYWVYISFGRFRGVD